MISLFSAASAALLFYAPFASGSGYFSVLRFAVCVSAALSAYRHKLLGTEGPLFWSLVAIAFIFNPIIPVHLYNRGAWFLIDLGSAIILIFSVIKSRSLR